MAEPTTSNQLLIALGDGGDPTETFAHPCGANAQSVTFTNNTGEEVLLDCTDPLGEMAAITRWTESQDTQISISGRVATESFATWRAWADSGATKNIQVQVLNTAALGGGAYVLPAILQGLEWGREGKGTIALTATIVGAGQRSYTAAT